MWRASQAVVVAIVVVLAWWMMGQCELPGGVACAEPVVVLDLDDPVGDDYGPGTYVYPSHKSFVPGLFDLVHFRVSYDPEYVYFDASFREVTNPWNAPEGFSHQLLNIYIDSVKGAGRTDTFRPGAMVAFDKRHGWDVFVKALGWGGCRAFSSQDGAEARGLSDGLRATVLADGKTIRVAVPRAVIGQPDRSWAYYVLVGSQDAFGEDDFRPVMQNQGAWVFGGGTDLDFDPNVIDMLAAPRGRHTQERLLGSYDAERGSLAVLVPVSAASSGAASPGPARSAVIAGVGVLFVGLVAAAVFVWMSARRRPKAPPRS